MSPTLQTKQVEYIGLGNDTCIINYVKTQDPDRPLIRVGLLCSAGLSSLQSLIIGCRVRKRTHFLQLITNARPYPRGASAQSFHLERAQPVLREFSCLRLFVDATLVLFVITDLSKAGQPSSRLGYRAWFCLRSSHWLHWVDSTSNTHTCQPLYPSTPRTPRPPQQFNH